LLLDENDHFLAAAAARAWDYLCFNIAALRTSAAAFDAPAKWYRTPICTLSIADCGQRSLPNGGDPDAQALTKECSNRCSTSDLNLDEPQTIATACRYASPRGDAAAQA
jgi:hypothetical protein